MRKKTGARAKRLTRGAVATRTGINLETIRYYERIGLMPAPPRTEGGHRIYGEDLLKRLNFIRRSRELGFTLEEVRGLLGLVDGGRMTCGQVQALTLDHLEEVRGKIADLKRLEAMLAGMAQTCEGGAIPDCPIIDVLFEGLEGAVDDIIR